MIETSSSLRKSYKFGSVSLSLLDFDMSPIPKLIMVWVLTKPDAWHFYISHMLKVLRLTPAQWANAKKELIEKGFFIQLREHNQAGKLVWKNEFNDDPLKGADHE